MDIPDIVKKLVKKYGTRDPFTIAEELGAIVVSFPLENEVNGFYQYFQRNHIIYIDEKLEDAEKRFVCAHELGHMRLHRKANAIFMDSKTHMNTSKYEVEADRFAVNLLISDDAIEEHLDFTTSQLSRCLGVKKRLIDLRLKDFQ